MKCQLGPFKFQPPNQLGAQVYHTKERAVDLEASLGHAEAMLAQVGVGLDWTLLRGEGLSICTTSLFHIIKV